jgi:hypothetical protein
MGAHDANADAWGLLHIPKQRVVGAIDERCTSARRRRERNLRHEILRPEDLVHDLADVVQVLVEDLDEEAAGGGEQLAGDEQPLAQAFSF